ncbi:MAG: LapA family protein [Gammaproteobacteria bacterium]|nr:LapA family protein [Gammaproteobacteria bacterium]
MMRMIAVLLVLFIVMVALLFGLLNAGTVTLDYYWGQWQLPLSWLLLLTLVAGMMIGVLLGLLRVIRLQLQLRGLRRQLRDVPDAGANNTAADRPGTERQ